MGILRLLAALGAGALLAGCASVGATGMRNARPAYNEALAQTEFQQQLANIIRLRFAEDISFLRVASIAANWNFRITPSVDAGFGPSANYAGNLVPFSISGTYAENPTITFLPIEGAEFAEFLVQPISIAAITGLLNTSLSPGDAFRLFITNVNDCGMPMFVQNQGAINSEKFERIAELVQALFPDQTAYFVNNTGQAPILRVVNVPRHKAEIAEFLALLGQKPMPAEATGVAIRVVNGSRVPVDGEVTLIPHTLAYLLRLAAASVDLPPELEPASVPLTLTERFKGMMHIHCGKDSPKGASVAVQYRDYWFWIADDDIRSKQLFYQTVVIARLQHRESSPQNSTPMLTLPVAN